MILLLNPSQEGLSGRNFPSTLEKIVAFTEIRALKINGSAKVILDLVKRVGSQSDALVEFSVTNDGISLAIRPLNDLVAGHEWEDFVVGVSALFREIHMKP